jgi:quinoprotein glucose dehydrogenase
MQPEKIQLIRNVLVLLAFVMTVACGKKDASDGDQEWREYLGGHDRNHYSSLSEINASNVDKLQVAWVYHTQDSGQIQCNPIIVNGIIYAMTATVQPFALEAATGKEIWRIRDTTSHKWYGTSRGVTYWENDDDKRILYTKESWLYAVDAMTGKPILTFGDSGRASLGSGLGPLGKKRFIISNTPGAVYEDLIIMPLRLSEGNDAAPGYIQAFNIRTGQLAWVFKTIPHPGEFGYDSWPKEAYQDSTLGAANNWAGIAVDQKRGIVFVPTGSAAFDFYGANRHGDNLFANTLLALEAKTGKRLWHFQMVHHDILDRDAPAPPNLLTVTQGGKRIDAVAQVTKQGYVFLFNRENGEPLFPIEEIPAPPSDVPGEKAAPTQPRPVKPLPYARQGIEESDISPFASNKDELLKTLKKSRSEGPWAPLSKQGTVIFPGLDGGAEWGGAAVDPDGIMYLNSSEMPWIISLDTVTEKKNIVHPGEKLYLANCATCHGPERKGNPASGYPSLLNVKRQFKREQVFTVIGTGKGMMTANKTLTDDQKNLIVSFLYGDKFEGKADKKEAVAASTPKKDNYTISGYIKFLDKDGYPAVKPPWGTLNAIDLNTGEYLWKKTFGEVPELEAKGITDTGSDSYGGPVITASGLLFIAGTKDGKFRVYNKKDGNLLWETVLPAPAFATPSTYSVNGKQYIVLACGGTKLGAPKGESYVAFALP